MLTVSVQNIDGVTILKCRGRLVRGTEKSLLCAAARLTGNLTLDISELDAIDAAGIGLLISLQAAGIYPILLNPTDSVRRVLMLTGVDTVVQISTSSSAETNPMQPMQAALIPDENVVAMPLAG